MKKVFVLCSILIFAFYGKQSLAQESGKVLVKNLEGSYTGDIKKGLAHGEGKAVGIDTYIGHFKKGYPDGKGTYYWINGDTHTGEWHKGKRSGKGEFHTKVNKLDTIYTGDWKNDKIRPITIAPAVVNKSSIDRYSFKRIGEGCLISIKFKQHGVTNTSVSNLIIDGDSGIEVEKGNAFCYENFELPFKCSVRYSTYNKLQSTVLEAKFEFVITQMGNWELVLHN